MKVHVDFDVNLSDGTAFGMVSGTLDFEVVPSIGGIVILVGATKAQLPTNLSRPYSGHFLVEKLMYRPEGTIASSVILVLEPLEVGNVEDARLIMRYLEEGFGLFGDDFSAEEADHDGR